MARLTLEEYRAQQTQEWGVYVATAPIFIRGVRAFNAGDPVPESHVTGGLVPEDRVARVQQDEPAGNADLDAWQRYARSKGATEDDLAGKGRDELRATYTEKG